ncbi:Hypoxanthine-guanine phosphoribosyltransferase [Sinobacterium norvegicum]|uniref:Hypoxanthine-guanine phosphoribosyltransferase n=1 Tax=Sinobacterium norvegicum TaxID=1641715 RepID=A0ABN8EL88_9GAMM|nr:hypoxanthine-guanine phosphoribosyltransferase [Sinobacterium norvegicum]CAH0991642.1 Hypoxanthine-guanine phosphoribosyltransferase [Sinobacterium norvegicum]
MSQVSEIRQVMAEADLVVSEETINAAYDKMAAEITDKLADKDPIFVCVMNGGLVTTSEVTKRLQFPSQIDYCHATRYRDETVGGETLEWRATPQRSLEGRVVVVVDDILDEGVTLASIIESCKVQGAAEIYSAVLVNKLHDRKVDKALVGDFVGLEVEDRFIFGCGMDYKGYLRNLPAIYALKDH